MAATLQQKATYVTELAGRAKELGQALQENEERARLIEELVGAGMDGTRDELRDAMNFKVKTKDGKGEVKSIDERGQRQSIESEDAASKYQSLDPESAVKAQRALEQVLAKAERMKTATTKRKNEQQQDVEVPLFTATQIIDELFKPLIREGLLPDNLLTDDKSPVAQMLKAVMQSYREMLIKQKQERELEQSKADSNYHNAGTRTERLQSVGVKVGAFVEGQLSAVADRAGMTPAELKRAAAIAGKSGKLAGDLYKGYSQGKALDKKLSGVAPTKKLSETLQDMSPPSQVASEFLSKFAGQLEGIDGGALDALLGEVGRELRAAGYSLDEMIAKGGSQVLDVLRKFAKLIESDGVAISSDVANVLIDGVGGGLEIAGISGERYQAGVDVDVAVRRAELRAGVRDLARRVEAALQSGLLVHGVPVARAVSGGFPGAFDGTGLIALIAPALGVEPDTAPQSTEVVDFVARAMSQALLKAHAELAPAGEQLAQAYTAACSGEISRLGAMLRKGELADPANCLLPLAERVPDAAGKVFGSDAFLEVLNKPEVNKALDEAAKALDREEQEAELEAAERELEDFERDLVLIDEGGMDVARQQTLDKMIAQLKSDQLDLDIVLKAGSLLSGVGGGITKLGTDARNVDLGKSIVDQGTGQVAKTVATEVAQSLLPALEAAQLVMKMSVTIIKIAGRYKLASKFGADVKKARKSGSYLLPSIENFYDTKVQQQIFASLELALQTVQLAGAICATVPEPITMAVGRALNAAAKAGESARDLAKTVYDEKQLRKGWKVTIEAINNPANRRAGLDALYHNSTLAVHSVAWAATKSPPDPMAMEIMRSCNVDAQTMADEGSDKDKVIAYLETLLNEDLRFKDEAQLNLDWAPKPLQLSYAGWFTLKARARKANPPLAEDTTDAIDKAFKDMDTMPPLHTIQALPGTDRPQAVTECKAAATRLKTLLEGYKPLATDRSAHTEMASVCQQLVRLAVNREKDLDDLLIDLG